jgi:hypothetical protein
MAKIEAVVLRRNKDENTIALVSAECDPEMVGSSDDLYGAISRAVTRWSRTCSAGRRLLKANGGDIDIGDLAAETIDSLLKKELRREGVTALAIECRHGDAGHWAYDDNLYDDWHVE